MDSDVSETAIVFSYTRFTILYTRVIIMWKKGKVKSLLKGLIFPVLATIGSAIILAGGIAANPVYTPIFSRNSPKAC